MIIPVNKSQQFKIIAATKSWFFQRYSIGRTQPFEGINSPPKQFQISFPDALYHLIVTYLCSSLVVTKSDGRHSHGMVLLDLHDRAVRQPEVRTAIGRVDKVLRLHVLHPPQLSVRQLNEGAFREVAAVHLVVVSGFEGRLGRRDRSCQPSSRNLLGHSFLEVQRCTGVGEDVSRSCQDAVL